MKKVGLLILVLFTFSWANSQEVLRLQKDKFFITDRNFDDAYKNLKNGHKFYKKHKKGYYLDAIKHFEKAYEYNSEYAPLCYELGMSYLLTYNKTKALFYLEKAFNLNPNVSKDIHFALARAYHLNGKFQDAIDEYRIYLNSLPKSKTEKYGKIINKYIQECENGIELSKSPKPVLLDNLGENVNTPYPEYSPVFAPYDSIVFFASRRPNNLGKKRNKLVSAEFFEDIYYTSAKKGIWYQPAILEKPINSKGNDAPVAINSQGTGILLYRGAVGNGDILISFRKMRKDGSFKWSKPKPIIKKINSKKYKETSLTFTHDSSAVIFISNRKGGYGGKDLWISYRRGQSLSGWTKPQNLGKTINTPYDEESVFLLDNDSVLYFSSRGHNSIGGFDIFRSYKLPDGRWSEPENLGVPFNSPGDDMFIFVNKDRRTGYFASNARDDGYGDFDLYWFFIYRPKNLLYNTTGPILAFDVNPIKQSFVEEPVPIKTMRMTIVKGTVAEYETNKPLAARIEIVDNAQQKVINVVQTDPQTGAYTVMLPSGKDYGFAVLADGYMFYSENFNIPASTGYQELVRNYRLLPINPGAKVVLRNVFFDFGKATLRPESYPELNRIAEAFKLYPKLVIEISGHTDNKGSRKTNLKLSQARAQAVVDYLVSIGVPRERLIAKGYADTQPIADNKTEEGRQLNRRVEAKIISY